MTPLLRLVLGSILSVLGSAYLSLFLPLFAPGILFGALVLAPQVSGSERKALRRLALIVVSGLTYFGASFLALKLTDHFGDLAGYGAAGLLGALVLLTFARPLLSAALPARRWLEAAGFGLLGGAALPLGVKAFGVSLLTVSWSSLIPCFLIWQVGVALALFRTAFEAAEKAQASKKVAEEGQRKS